MMRLMDDAADGVFVAQVAFPPGVGGLCGHLSEQIPVSPPHLARKQASCSRHMSHTTRSTLFFATASSFQEHRRQRLESISLRTRRSVLRANIGNEWNTPDLNTWRSQPNLNKQVWSSPSTSHHATFVLGSSTVVTGVGSIDQSRACHSTSFSANAFVDQHLRSLSRRLLPAPKNVTFREQPRAAIDPTVSSECSSLMRPFRHAVSG